MKLFFTDGQKQGDKFDLSPPGASIGRELDNDIILEGEGESRYHAKLEIDAKEWKIKDLGSTNGTKLNGEKLSPNEATAIKEGYKILIGKQTMLFAEKLPESTDDIIPLKDEKDSDDEKKEGTTGPSIIAIKSPSPMDETIPDEKLVEEKNGDKKSSKTFSDFFDDGDAEKDKKSFNDSTDFFGKTKMDKPEIQKDGKKKHASILFYVAVLGVAVILVSIFLMFEKNRSQATTKNPAAAKKRTGAPLLIRYEKQVTTTSPRHNIFRYLMEIKHGKVTITIDDLRAKYKQNLSRNVTVEQLQELEDKIRETDFMETKQPQIGIRSEEKDNVQSMTIAYGKNMNTITVKNTPPPRSFIESRNYLEEFSSDVLNIPPISLTPEEMKEAGIAAYQKAKQHYNNYQAKEENLNIAIKFFGIATENLQGFKHLPEYETSYKLKQEAEILLKEQVEKHFSNMRRFVRLKSWSEAREEMLSVMAKMDPGTKQYNNAKKAVIELERTIKNKRK